MTQPLRPDNSVFHTLSDPTARLPFLSDAPLPRRIRAYDTRSRTDGTQYVSDYGHQTALEYDAPMLWGVTPRPVMSIVARPAAQTRRADGGH